MISPGPNPLPATVSGCPGTTGDGLSEIRLLAVTVTCVVTGEPVPAWADTLYPPDGVLAGMVVRTWKVPDALVAIAWQPYPGTALHTWTCEEAGQLAPLIVSWLPGTIELGDTEIVGVGAGVGATTVKDAYTAGVAT